MKFFRAFIIGAAIALILLIVAYIVIDQAKVTRADLPNLYDVPEFSFTDLTGNTFGLDRMKGKLRYINEERQYQLDKFVEEPVDSTVAVQAVEEVIKYYMIPDVALMLLRLRGICAMGAEYNQVTIADRFILERLITLERMIDGIPVFNSKASFAVNNRGEISRIFLRWPSFRMTPDLQLKSRDHLVSEIVDRLVKALEGRPIELRIQMAYIPVEDEEIRYVPGLVVSAMDNASPILFTVNAAH